MVSVRPLLTAKTQRIFLCDPGGIFAVVVIAAPTIRKILSG